MSWVNFIMASDMDVLVHGLSFFLPAVVIMFLKRAFLLLKSQVELSWYVPVSLH